MATPDQGSRSGIEAWEGSEGSGKRRAEGGRSEGGKMGQELAAEQGKAGQHGVSVGWEGEQAHGKAIFGHCFST